MGVFFLDSRSVTFTPGVSKLTANKSKPLKMEVKVFRTEESPFVVHKLVNGDEYQFLVRTVNHIASASSTLSARVTPLCLPPRPRIMNITGKPNELYVRFKCPGASNRDVQAKFEVIVDPPLNEKAQDYPIKNHRLCVSDSVKPVALRGVNLRLTHDQRMIV